MIPGLETRRLSIPGVHWEAGIGYLVSCRPVRDPGSTKQGVQQLKIGKVGLQPPHPFTREYTHSHLHVDLNTHVHYCYMQTAHVEMHDMLSSVCLLHLSHLTVLSMSLSIISGSCTLLSLEMICHRVADQNNDGAPRALNLEDSHPLGHANSKRCAV